ncbi:MAG: thymidylate kinase [Ruminococcaceae bacterium]|nr:thymidylate kinase [Oscillospiraceae bacterium]
MPCLLNKGKLIVIDGVDGSGKQTQSLLLTKALEERKINVKKIEFPCYDDDSSALIKMYLKGDFGSSADDVNPYAASTFYAVDRFASYKKDWGTFYNDGGIIVADRYVTSNAIHQASKLSGKDRDDYFSWLEDFEYVKIGLPRPDLVIFLDMHPEYTKKLIEKRYEGDMSKKDLHEKDEEYTMRCYNGAVYACEKFGWCHIKCAENGIIKSIDEIHSQVLEKVLNILE